MGHWHEQKELRTVERIGEFKGSKIFEIWKCNEDGEPQGERPFISFGTSKAKAIMQNIEGLKEFLGQGESQDAPGK